MNDGVKLVKIGEYPARLDRIYYNIDPAQTIAIDGNQYYWVQIGKDKAKQLSSNDLARWICDGGVLFVAGATLVAGEAAIIAGDAGTLGIATPLAVVAGGGLAVAEGAMVAVGTQLFCPWLEKFFIDKHIKDKSFDADGCVLLRVEKRNVGVMKDLKKIGIDLGTIKHLPSAKKACPPNQQYCTDL